MSKVLTIGDVHEPVCHPGYRAFCSDLRDKHGTDTTVFIGDIADWQAISFHAHSPEMPGPKDEFDLAQQGINGWYKEFPKAKVCIGNHDERLIRLAASVNIPSKFLRDYPEIWKTPKWDWKHDHVIDEVYYYHGTGAGGIHPAYTTMMKMCMSVVMGHIHSAAGVKWRANPNARFFGLDVGCGIDQDALAFAYNRHNKARSILSAAVIIDGVPQHIIMQCGRKEKYHKSRFV